MSWYTMGYRTLLILESRVLGNMPLCVKPTKSQVTTKGLSLNNMRMGGQILASPTSRVVHLLHILLTTIQDPHLQGHYKSNTRC